MKAHDIQSDLLEDHALMETLSDPLATADRKAAAWELIVDRHFEVMCSCAGWMLRSRGCRTLDAEDVVQQVFAHLLVGAASKFKRGRPLRPWLLQVLRNKAKDLIRRERKYQGDKDLGSLDGRSGPAQDAWSLADELESLLARIEEEDAAMFRRFYLEDRSAQEVAHEKGWTVPQVYRKLHQIRSKLREQVGDDHDGKAPLGRSPP